MPPTTRPARGPLGRARPGASAPGDDELVRARAAELAPLARARRERRHGARVTVSPSLRIAPLGCGVAACPRRPVVTPLAGRGPSSLVDEMIGVGAGAAASGCEGVVLCCCERAGRRPGDHPGAADHRASVALLGTLAERLLGESGLLARLELDTLDEDDLAGLRSRIVSQATPAWMATDLRVLEAAGRLRVPFGATLPVGPRPDREGSLAALRAIAASQADHGHVQEVVLGRVRSPHLGTGTAAGQVDEELAWTIAAARLVLPAEVHVQVAPSPAGDLRRLLDAGADDLGSCPPDRSAPSGETTLGAIRAEVDAAGAVLAPRLVLHPEWALEPRRWLDERLRFPVLDRSDAEGLARDASWVAGGTVAPPRLVATDANDPAGARRRPAGLGRIGEILEAARTGEVLDEEALVVLFAARGREVAAVAEVADELRAEAVGDTVTFVQNRNVNFTNVCTFKCRFCAFSKGPRSLNLREAPFLLEPEEITRRVVEAEERGATEVCLQGGIHPDFDGDSYLEVVRAVRAGSPRIHIHGFSALEVAEGARRLGTDLETFLRRLRDAGLGSLPGTAAEILDDEVRGVLCPDKLTTEEWIEVHRTAHRVGLCSNVTIMFGAVEQPRHWARHLVVTRELQQETGGFTEFVPLPFVHMATPLYLRGRARRGPTFREVLLVHAVGRIAYHRAIDNVQVSWVKLGTDGLRQLLRAGGNDVGGTLMEESIARAAGAAPLPFATPESFRATIEPLGRRVAERTTLYERVGSPVGPATTPAS